MGTRAENKSLTRQRILDHARHMVMENGPDGMTITPLMSALGLTHGGFYAHFQSREQLLDHVVVAMCEMVLVGLQRNSDPVSPMHTLEAYIDGYLSAKHRDSVTWGCPLAYLSQHVPQLSNAAKATYADAHRSLTGQLTILLRRAGARSTSELARSLVAELVGALSISRALGDSQESKNVLAAARRQMKARVHAHVDVKTPTTER